MADEELHKVRGEWSLTRQGLIDLLTWGIVTRQIPENTNIPGTRESVKKLMEEYGMTGLLSARAYLDTKPDRLDYARDHATVMTDRAYLGIDNR